MNLRAQHGPERIWQLTAGGSAWTTANVAGQRASVGILLSVNEHREDNQGGLSGQLG